MAANTLLDPNTFKGADLLKQAQALKSANAGRKSTKAAKADITAVLGQFVQNAQKRHNAAISSVVATRDNMDNSPVMVHKALSVQFARMGVKVPNFVDWTKLV